MKIVGERTSGVKVNTEAVVMAAEKIRKHNDQIRDDFSSVQNAITKLDNCWEGEAATNAISKFYEMKSDYAEARYSVLDNYTNFMLQQVGEGYVQTEDANESLASQFK